MKVKHFNSFALISTIAVLASGCASSNLQQPALDSRLEPPVVVAKTTDLPVVLQETDVSSEIRPISYAVKKGDSLSMIASRYDVTVNDLATWNGISNPNKIRVGQKLTLEANTALSDKSFITRENIRTLSGDSYTIQQGDTLSEVASAFKTTVPALKQINSLQSDTIHIGKRLLIPKPAEATKAATPDMVVEPVADTNTASVNVQEPSVVVTQ